MPRKSKTGFSLPYQSVEDMGFSSTHRRDGDIYNFTDNTFSADITSEIVETQQVFPDLSFTGDKIESLTVNKLRAGSLNVDDYIQSTGFITGSVGWKITGDGNAEFSSGTFRGSVTAATIDIGGSDATSFHVDIDGNMWSGAGTFADATFSVTNAGVVTANLINYSAYSGVGLMNASQMGVANNAVMTSKGRYLIANTAANTLSVWDAWGSYIYNYRRNPEYTRAALAITPNGLTRVLDASTGTEYIIGFNLTGTAGYRYDADGQNEAAITVSGVVLISVRAIGYYQKTGYVYIADGGATTTTIYRFTFSGTTLTYVDTITLSAAPAAYSISLIWISDSTITFLESLTNNSTGVFKRYNSSGTAVDTRSWGHGVSGTSVLGICVREDDNGLLWFHETSNAADATSVWMRIQMD